jgi:hypothetical protein
MPGAGAGVGAVPSAVAAVSAPPAVAGGAGAGAVTTTSAAAALPLPEVVETGNPAVDAALARLAAAGEVPAEARAGVYGEVHDLLRDTLAGLDERAGGAPTPLNAIR